MLIDLKRIAEGGLRIRRTLALDPFPPDRDLRAAGPAEVDLAVREDARGVVVEGVFEVEVTLVCARCLRDFGLEIGAHFTSTYRYPPQAYPEEAQVQDQDLDLSYLEDDQENLDLREVVLEQVFLNLPMKPLHDAECKGLCSACGADRNETACGCRQETIDPRLEGLAALKARLESQ